MKKINKTEFVPSDNLDCYLYWMCERMNIFWNKYEGGTAPYTQDPILHKFKFTNVYRCLDRVSQHLLKNVIYNGKKYSDKDMFFRILLFRHLNKCETWDALVRNFGDITYDTGLMNIADFLDSIIISGKTVYGNAYTINCSFYQSEKYQYIKGVSKYRAHLMIFESEIFNNNYYKDILDSMSFKELYQNFRELDICGDFTAQQYAIDMNYSELFNFTENEFVVTGPGSLKGISFVFENTTAKGYDFSGAIHWVQDNFEVIMSKFCADSGMEWRPLPWEPIPTLTNLQNCFCETSKYAKGLGHSFKKGVAERIKNTYEEFRPPMEYVFPPKWGDCNLNK